MYTHSNWERRTEADNERWARERRRLLSAHTKTERRLEVLLRELRHSMPSERAEIRADVEREQRDLRQLSDELRAMEGRAA